MTRKDSDRTISEIKAIMGEDGDFLRPVVRTVIQEFLEAEIAEILIASILILSSTHGMKR